MHGWSDGPSVPNIPLQRTEFLLPDLDDSLAKERFVSVQLDLTDSFEDLAEKPESFIDELHLRLSARDELVHHRCQYR